MSPGGTGCHWGALGVTGEALGSHWEALGVTGEALGVTGEALSVTGEALGVPGEALRGTECHRGSTECQRGGTWCHRVPLGATGRHWDAPPPPQILHYTPEEGQWVAPGPFEGVLAWNGWRGTPDLYWEALGVTGEALGVTGRHWVSPGKQWGSLGRH